MEAIIKKLTEQHPESVAQLLNGYGYEAAPTARNLTNLVKVHGNTPLPFSNATGTKKKTLLDYLAGLGTVLIAAKTGKLPAAKPVIIGTNGIEDPTVTAPSPRVLGIDRNIFLAIAALTVIALAIILFKK